MSASDIAGRRIREARERLKWSRDELAERCAKAGSPHITATIITNLEKRRRASREITLDELLTIAYVLDVTPLQLMTPINAGEELEIADGVSKDMVEVVGWLADDSGFYDAATWTAITSGEAPVNPPAELDKVGTLRSLRRRVILIATAHREGRPEDVAHYGNQLMIYLAKLTAWGYTPPELPETMAILREHGQPASVAEWEMRATGVSDGKS